MTNDAISASGVSKNLSSQIEIDRDKGYLSSGLWGGDSSRNQQHPFNEVDYLQIQCYSDHPEVYRMAELIVDSYLKTKRKVHDRGGLILSARKLVASLWLHPSDWFRFSTREDHFGKARKQVWMTHKVLSLFRHMREMDPPLIDQVAYAIPKALSRDGVGRSAIYCRKWFFTNTLKELKVRDICIDPNLPRVTLRTSDDIWIPIQPEEKERWWYKFSDETLRLHSEMLYNVNICLSDGSEMPPPHWHYFRRFKGCTKVTGRLYSTFTTYPKTKRLGVTFDGVPAMSLDFTALHPHLLLRILHQRDRESDRLLIQARDPYDIPTFRHLPREFHKKCVNTLFNAVDLNTAIQALRNTHYWYDAIQGEVVVVTYKTRVRRRGLKGFPGNSREAMQYIESFKLFHPELAPYICRGAGRALQWTDSQIMLWLMRLGVEAKVSVLPIHDEIVFPVDRANDIEYLLTRAVQTVLKNCGNFGELGVKRSWIEDEQIVSERIVLDLEEIQFASIDKNQEDERRSNGSMRVSTMQI